MAMAMAPEGEPAVLGSGPVSWTSEVVRPARPAGSVSVAVAVVVGSEAVPELGSD